MKKGTIILWYGAIAAIPYGWHLCNGDHGTPDLEARFVVGAGDTYNPNDTGGSGSHTHPFTATSHYHDLLLTSPDVGSPGLCYRRTNSKAVTGITNFNLQLPPWKLLCYIMKLVQSRHDQ